MQPLSRRAKLLLPLSFEIRKQPSAAKDKPPARMSRPALRLPSAKARWSVRQGQHSIRQMFSYIFKDEHHYENAFVAKLVPLPTGPGQTLALQGVWEGDGLLTAEYLYAGAMDDYLRHRSRAPGINLVMALFCGGLAVVLAAIGVVLRFVSG